MSITLEDLDFEETDPLESRVIPVQFFKFTSGFKDNFDDVEVISLGGHSDTNTDEENIEKTENQHSNDVSVDNHNVTRPRLINEEGRETPEEKPTTQNKWETLRRIAQVLGIKRRISEKKCSSDPDDDELSFDGHLFEYSPHLPVVPKVEVPRLRLKPTLKERVVNVVRRLFVCGVNRRHYDYEMD